MHLLNVDTLKIETFYDAKPPRYAILSHTWVREEVTFTDIQEPQSLRTTSLAGFEKVRKTCDQARIDGYQYVWIDTCCIDKSSSAELSEAINSMFQWYREASICYAYLCDVTEADFEATFPTSRWFTRGWTLQELLAPENVLFYDRDWHKLGTRVDHAEWISIIAGIDLEALVPPKVPHGYVITLNRFCIAKRMSWASNRETTRVEDIAYCLLGIFDIKMPLLYGERERAFVRLQEELIKKYDDDSILAWGFDTDSMDPIGIVSRDVEYCAHEVAHLSSILASSPKDFEHCQDLQYDVNRSTRSFTMNKAGLQIELPLVTIFPEEFHDSMDKPQEREPQHWIGLLSCSTGKGSDFLGIILMSYSPSGEFCVEVLRLRCPRSELPDWHTVLVGPRAAMQAERRTVTIIQEAESISIRDHAFGYRNFIVSETKALLDAGYEVSYATGNNFGRCRDYLPSWNPTAKVLTIPDTMFDDDLQRFEFARSGSASGFTLLLRSGKAMVLKGVTISHAEEENSHRYLGQANNSTQGMVLQSHDGSNKLVGVTIRENNTVHFSRTMEIRVDLIPHHDERFLQRTNRRIAQDGDVVVSFDSGP